MRSRAPPVRNRKNHARSRPDVSSSPLAAPCIATAAQYGGRMLLIGTTHPGSSRMGKRKPDSAKTGYSSPRRNRPTERQRIASGAKNMLVAHKATTASRSDAANQPGSAIVTGYPNRSAPMPYARRSERSEKTVVPANLPPMTTKKDAGDAA